jgi:hypothetical protein
MPFERNAAIGLAVATLAPMRSIAPTVVSLPELTQHVTLRALLVVAIGLWLARSVHAQPAEAPAEGASSPVGSAPAPALAPGRDPAFAARVEHMDAWLATLAGSGARVRAIGVLYFAVGGVSAAVGLWLGSDDASEGREERVVALAILESLAAIELTKSVYQLAFADRRESLRYERWRALPAVDALTLARFEGELQAEAAIDRQYRIESGFGNIGLAAGGVALLAITPFTHAGRDAAATYVIGGINVVLGVWGAIANLAGESTGERAWRSYREGKLPEQAAATRFGVFPMLARRSAGVVLAGML